MRRNRPATARGDDGIVARHRCGERQKYPVTVGIPGGDSPWDPSMLAPPTKGSPRASSSAAPPLRRRLATGPGVGSAPARLG